jgi:hypothetical protein
MFPIAQGADVAKGTTFDADVPVTHDPHRGISARRFSIASLLY